MLIHCVVENYIICHTINKAINDSKQTYAYVISIVYSIIELNLVPVASGKIMTCRLLGPLDGANSYIRNGSF
jgi:hypothetical protein